MQRRAFFKTAALAGLAAPMTVDEASGYVPPHNWEKYDFGSGPPVKNRLYQGPFVGDAQGRIVGGTVVMANTPTEDVVPGFGKGPVTYITANMGLAEIVGDDKLRAIEELVRVPLGQKLYIRPTWREVEPRRGRLELPEYIKLVFELAKKYDKRVGFRIQMSAPDYREEALPQFILDNVPMVRLEGEWRPEGKSTVVEPRYDHPYYDLPRYDHPYFQEAFEELDGLLAAEFNGNPAVEFFDTFHYGFWGEGHSSPYRNNPFPNYRTAERTWIRMFETQLQHWTKTPLVTNGRTNGVGGDSDVLDSSIRTHNWLRKDTIYIGADAIDMMSNRPPWTAVAVEVGGAQGIMDESEESIRANEGVPSTDNGIQHVMDVGANYWSLWCRHRISAANIMKYYERYPKVIDQMCRKIGYNVRPSFVWASANKTNPGLVIGFTNDGIAGVPGVLYVSVVSDDGKVNVGGGLDPGYPLPGKMRHAQLVLPEGTHWEGLKLKAELEVKGVRYPVRWATHQKTNPDGSLTLRLNRPLGPGGY